MHSLPWTLALALAAQAGEIESVRIPKWFAGSALESSVNPEGPESALNPETERAESKEAEAENT